MQMKIIALAIAAAMAAPAAAMAAPTVYGQVNMAYEIVDDGGDGAAVGTTANSRNLVSSNVSRLGVKGSEDLGNGMTGVFQMEGEVKTDTGASSLFTRNTFLGLAGNFGTVVLGRHDTPYKMSTRDMDVFKDTIADNRSLMGLAGINLDVRASDVLAYLTPEFNGFSAAVAMVGDTDNTLTATGDAVLTTLNALGAPGLPANLSAGTSTVGATTLSAQYGMGGWKAVLGYITVNVKDTAAPAVKFDVTGTKLGGSYSMDALTVSAVYEMASLKVSGWTDTVEQNNLYISGKYNVSDAGAVKLAYTMASELKAATDIKGTGASQMSVGYDHALTKNTTVFALYSSISNDYDAATGIGSSYGFNSGGSTGDTGAAGGLIAGGSGNPSAIAVGMRHSF